MDLIIGEVLAVARTARVADGRTAAPLPLLLFSLPLPLLMPLPFLVSPAVEGRTRQHLQFSIKEETNSPIITIYLHYNLYNCTRYIFYPPLIRYSLSHSSSAAPRPWQERRHAHTPTTHTRQPLGRQTHALLAIQESLPAALVHAARRCYRSLTT